MQEIISRSEAKALGLSRYFTGIECIRGHISERRVSTGLCVECSRVLGRKHGAMRRKNPEYMESQREYLKTYQNKNKSEISKRYYDKHKDRERVRSREKQRKNSDYYAFKCAERRAKIKAAKPAWFEADKVREVYRMASVLGLEVDHVVPLQSDMVCGLHCWHNLQLLDRKNNAKKLNVFWPDMA